MKKLLLTALLCVSFSALGAEITPQDEHQICQGFGVLSGDVMTLRQKNLPSEKVIEEIISLYSYDKDGNPVELDPFTQDAIVRATNTVFELPVGNTEEEKQNYINIFAVSVYQGCMEEFTKSRSQ